MPSQTSHAHVVLGASGDIGSAVARQLHRGGHSVFLASRESERLEQIARELEMPSRAIDATDLAAVANCLTTASEEFGRLDGVVNCVGSVLLKPAHLTSEVEWQETIATNLTSAFAAVRAAGKTMIQSGGSVILVASAAALVGLANHEAIAAAKAGVIGLAKAAAATYASTGLRFNVVAPGLVKTKLTKRIWSNERAAAMSRSMHALGKFGEPEQVASLITWLLDPTNDWMTGEVIACDGGLSTVQPAGGKTAR